MHSQIRLIHLLLVTCVLSITPIVSSTFSVSAIAQTQTREQRRGKAIQLNQEALELESSGELKAALGKLEQALQIAKEIGDRYGESATLNNIGGVYASLKQHTKALEVLQQALAIAKEIGYRESIGTALNNIGKIYVDLKKYAKALEVLQPALEIHREMHNSREEGIALNNIAAAYTSLNQDEKGLEVLQLALVIARETGNSVEVNHILGNIKNLYFNIGTRFVDQKQYLRALEAYQQSLAIAKEVRDREHKARTLSKIGQVYSNLQQYTKALEFYTQALEAYNVIGDRKKKATILHTIGQTYGHLGQYKNELELYQQALAVTREVSNYEEGGAILNSIGLVYVGRGQYIKALESFQQALVIAKSAKNRKGEGRTLGNIGLVYLNQGQPKNSLIYYQKALSIQTLTRDDEGKGVTLNNIGSVCRRMGQYEKALSFYRQALAIAKSSGNRGAEGVVLGNLGVAYSGLGKYTKALELYQQALEVFREIKDLTNEGKSLGSIGSIHRERGQSIKALDFYQQSLKIAKEVGSPAGEGIILNEIGLVYADQAQYAEALQVYQQSLKISKETGRLPDEGVTVHNIGLLYLNLGQYKKALEFFQKSLAIRKEVGDHNGEGTVLASIGLAYEYQEEYEKALGFYLQSLQILREVGDRSGEGVVLSNIGSVFSTAKQNAEALGFYSLALKIHKEVGDLIGEAHVLNNIGFLYYQSGQYTKAMESFQQSLAINQDREVGGREGEGGTLSNIGSTLAAEKKVWLAITFYKQSVRVYESIRGELKKLSREEQRSYTESVSGTYRRLADLLLSQGQVLEAQQVLELLKIQEIREFDRTTRAKISSTGELLSLDPTERTIVEKYGSYIKFIQEVRSCQTQTPQCPEIDKLMALRQQAKDEYERSIQKLNDELAKRQAKDKESFLDPHNPLSAKAARLTENRPDRAVIYSLVTDDRIWLILATQGAPLRPFEVQVSRKALSTAVKDFRELMEKCQQPGYVCTSADTEAVKIASQKLYRWLFPAELQKELPPDKIKHLIFSLDRNIRYIPMSALFNGKTYLVEKYALSTITTADRPENEPFSRTAQDTSVLAMGASEFPDGLPPLQNVKIELNAIVKDPARQDTHGIYPGLEFLNKNFNKRNLQNSLFGRNILHLASHGVFSLTTPYESYIALGDREKLNIPEIGRILDLSTIDLVVLSACQTALGGRENEEGVEIASLGSAFLQNQAKSVMASLWNVDDISTSLLMQEFYQNLAKNTPQSPITRAEALRQAQLQFIEGKTTIADGNRLRARASLKPVSKATNSTPNSTSDFRHPYYWSPFVLMGSGF